MGASVGTAAMIFAATTLLFASWNNWIARTSSSSVARSVAANARDCLHNCTLICAGSVSCAASASTVSTDTPAMSALTRWMRASAKRFLWRRCASRLGKPKLVPSARPARPSLVAAAPMSRNLSRSAGPRLLYASAARRRLDVACSRKKALHAPPHLFRRLNAGSSVSCGKGRCPYALVAALHRLLPPLDLTRSLIQKLERSITVMWCLCSLDLTHRLRCAFPTSHLALLVKTRWPNSSSLARPTTLLCSPASTMLKLHGPISHRGSASIASARAGSSNTWKILKGYLRCRAVNCL